MGFFAKRRQEKAQKARDVRLKEFERLLDAERLRTAVPELLAARDEAVAALGAQDRQTWKLWSWYARALGDEGRGDEAVREFRALAGSSGPDHQGRVQRLATLCNLGAQLTCLGRFEAAEAEARLVLVDVETLSVRHRTQPKLAALNTLARALVGLERGAEAEQTARDALALAAATNEFRTHFFERTLRVNLAAALNVQGRYAEALAVLNEAEATPGETAVHADASAIALARANALLGLGRENEAARTAEAGLEHALLAFGETHDRCRRLQALLARAEAGGLAQ